MDLSFLSNEKLAALEKGDLSQFTDEELKQIEGGQGQDLGTELAGVPPQQAPQIPDRINQLKAYAEQLDPASKEYTKYMGAYQKELDAFLKMNPQPKQQSMSTSGDAAKLLEIVTGGMVNLRDLEDEVKGGNMLIGQALPKGIGDRKGDFLLNDLTDRIGRLRSGGAITEGTNGAAGELGRFQQNLPGPLDFGEDAKLYKINKMREGFNRIGETLKGKEQYKSYLESILSGGAQSPQQPKKATHRLNPQTGQLEKI